MRKILLFLVVFSLLAFSASALSYLIESDIGSWSYKESYNKTLSDGVVGYGARYSDGSQVCFVEVYAFRSSKDVRSKGTDKLFGISEDFVLRDFENKTVYSEPKQENVLWFSGNLLIYKGQLFSGEGCRELIVAYISKYSSDLPKGNYENFSDLKVEMPKINVQEYFDESSIETPLFDEGEFNKKVAKVEEFNKQVRNACSEINSSGEAGEEDDGGCVLEELQVNKEVVDPKNDPLKMLENYMQIPDDENKGVEVQGSPEQSQVRKVINGLRFFARKIVGIFK